jgi:tryptophan-rich sensory protein
MVMRAIAAAASDQSGGHPLWHLLIVAGGAVGVFVAIKVKEHWDHDQRPRLTAPKAAILGLALCSAVAAAIHATVTAEHFEEAFAFGAFFLAASTLQAAWAVFFVYRPSRTLLVAAGLGNAAVIVLWTLTRTVGLPIGPETWQPEAVGALDVISTLFEVALVLGAAKFCLGDRRESGAQNAFVAKSVRRSITI